MAADPIYCRNAAISGRFRAYLGQAHALREDHSVASSERLAARLWVAQLPAYAKQPQSGGLAFVLARVDELQRAESGHWPVQQEHLDREVGLDVDLAEEGEHLAAGEL